MAVPASLLSLVPNCAWVRTGNFTKDGKPMWSSRQWKTGEKPEYLAAIQPKPAE